MFCSSSIDNLNITKKHGYYCVQKVPVFRAYICRCSINNTFETMISLKKFTFNPFSENTYVLWDETKEAIIIDPGMVDSREDAEMQSFIESEGLKPVMLFNTHAHIDHVLGNYFVKKTWEVPLVSHTLGKVVLQMAERSAEMYGIPYTPSPEADRMIEGGDVIAFGNSSMPVLFVPGHAPDHVALVDLEGKKVIAGDVLFNGSVGRVDLPGSDAAELTKSIQNKMYELPDDTVVYCGHGDETTIGKEKQSNPFVRPGWSGFLQGE